MKCSAQRARRRRSRSRWALSSRSLCRGSTRGRVTASPAVSRPTGAPSQLTTPAADKAKAASGAASSRARRSGISRASARRAAFSRGRDSSTPPEPSGMKRNPASWPTPWPSTMTSPALVTEPTSALPSFIRRSRWAWRRSTKRWVRTRWRASESLSSTARVVSCQWRGSAEPAGAMGDIGPGPDMGDARHQRIDIAVVAVEPGDMARDPIGGQPPLRRGQMAEDLAQQPRMGIAHHLAEIRDLADLPEQAHRRRPADAAQDLRILAELGEGLLVVRLAGPEQDRVGRARAPGSPSGCRRNGSRARCCATSARRWHRSGGSRWPPPSRAPAGRSRRWCRSCRRSYGARRGRRSGRVRPASGAGGRGRRTWRGRAKAT